MGRRHNGDVPGIVWPREAEIEPERKFPRLKRSLTFLLPDGWRGEVIDLSAVGLRIRSIAILTPRANLEGKLLLDDGTAIPLKVSVVWTTPPDHARNVLSEIGLKLLDGPDAYRAALADLFAEG